VDRRRGLERLTMVLPQLQEICYSRTSAMAQLPEQSWRCYKEDLTCRVGGLPKLAPSIASFSSQISFLTTSHQRVGLALGVSV